MKHISERGRGAHDATFDYMATGVGKAYLSLCFIDHRYQHYHEDDHEQYKLAEVVFDVHKQRAFVQPSSF
jgi:hypothetical protein